MSRLSRQSETSRRSGVLLVERLPMAAPGIPGELAESEPRHMAVVIQIACACRLAWQAGPVWPVRIARTRSPRIHSAGWFAVSYATHYRRGVTNKQINLVAGKSPVAGVGILVWTHGAVVETYTVCRDATVVGKPPIDVIWMVIGPRIFYVENAGKIRALENPLHTDVMVKEELGHVVELAFD